MPVDPDVPAFLAALLPAWRLPADGGTVIARAEHGTNNRTLLVTRDDRRFVLRVSENLTAAQVRAEQRLLRRLGRSGLPFGVPEPLPTTDGATMIETPAGPATLCRWLPGERPDLGREQALERFGRAVGTLGEALALVPPGHAAVRPLTPAEAEALPDLLPARALGSIVWRAGRWRRGQAALAEVTERIQRLETIADWLAANGRELVALAAAASRPAAKEGNQSQ